MLIYLSGPITVPDPLTNAHKAIEIADALVSAGFTPFVPQALVIWQAVKPHDWEWWLKYDLRVLDQCNVLIRLPGASKGADVEVERAVLKGIPRIIFQDDFDFTADEIVDQSIKLMKEIKFSNGMAGYISVIVERDQEGICHFWN